MKFKSSESILRASHPPKTIPRAAKPGSQCGHVPALSLHVLGGVQGLGGGGIGGSNVPREADDEGTGGS